MRIEVRVEVRDRAFEAAESLRRYVGLRLMSVLDHLVREVEGVTVALGDVSGDTSQKRCRMLAELTASGDAAVEERDAGLYTAIDRAAERLARGVALTTARRELTPLPPISEGRAWRVPLQRGASNGVRMEREMRIRVQGRGLYLTDGLRAHAQRRLLFGLSRFGSQVESVRLLLDDVNGPRGGVDKRCQIAVQLMPWGDVRVEQLDRNLYAVIDRAADRVHHAVAREMERRRQMPLVPAAGEGKERLR
jgi:ribosome-associated translation inhibitor RaiA